VLFNTGSGMKYLDVLDTRVERTLLSAQPPTAAKPAARQIAGVIGPY
jgi:hypothetical protein